MLLARFVMCHVIDVFKLFARRKGVFKLFARRTCVFMFARFTMCHVVVCTLHDVARYIVCEFRNVPRAQAPRGLVLQPGAMPPKEDANDAKPAAGSGKKHLVNATEDTRCANTIT